MCRDEKKDLKITKICITNRHLVKGFFPQDYLAQIECALKKEPAALILREKDLTEEEYTELAKSVIPLCIQYKVQFIINNFVNASIKLGINNIQLSIHRFMELTEEEKEHFQSIGVSVHSKEDALTAEKHSADYVIAGHIFSTDCKKELPPRGVRFLENICEEITLPVYAIGGIHENNISACMAAGAEGVCMMSEYMR